MGLFDTVGKSPSAGRKLGTLAKLDQWNKPPTRHHEPARVPIRDSGVVR